MMAHALTRTSPKGPGEKFIGTCMKCGQTGIPLSSIEDRCENPANLTQEETLIIAIEKDRP